jgi:hypothetical protein
MLNIATRLGKAATRKEEQCAGDSFVLKSSSPEELPALNLLTCLQAQRDRVSFRSQDSADALSAQEFAPALRRVSR